MNLPIRAIIIAARRLPHIQNFEELREKNQRNDSSPIIQ